MAFLISFSDKNYTIDEFIQIKKSDLPKWAIPIHKFLKNWNKGKLEFTQQTSGSTGKPKKIYIEKKQMMVSAHQTIEALKISENSRALLCISANYIGGKMMLVRAILGQWHLHIVKPRSKFKEKELWSHYEFAAMVPLQISSALVSSKNKEILNRFDQIIVGGGQVSQNIINQVQECQSKMYSTFGMTETVSHFALKSLNGSEKSDYFKVIGDNKISVDSKGCLMIKGSITDDQWLVTNDVVELIDNGFKWISRFDLVINTGGVKVQIEPTEQLIIKNLNTEGHHLIVWKIPDEKLGEKVIGICDSMVLLNHIKENKEALEESLPPYHFPKNWFLVDEIKTTKSGKIDRINTSKASLTEVSFE